MTAPAAVRPQPAPSTARAYSTRSRARRLRRRLTMLVTVVTAACLLGLGTVAAVTDGHARRAAADAELDRRVTGLSRSLWIDEGQVQLKPLEEDTLGRGPVTVTVLARSGPGFAVRRVHPAGRSAPPLPELQRMVERVTTAEDVVVGDLTPAGSPPLRAAAAPVWGVNEIGAVVVVTGISPDEAGHRRFLLFLAGFCCLLLSLVAATVHLMSGRTMGPVVGVLDRQEQFLAEAAHELRTPLSTLRLVAERGLAHPDRAAETARSMVRLADQLARVVTGLLARTRIQVGSQPVERLPLRLDLLVEQVIEDLPQDARGVTVHAEPVVVEGDPEMLAQAVRNLVENALVHGARPGRPAEVAVEVGPGRVAVQDNGPGLPRRSRDRRSAARRGTGLGLPIVRWVADLHGGELRLTRTPNGGVLAELRLGRARRRR